MILTLALAMVVGAATAQVTPQAVIGNAPSLPTPEQWAANNGHTEAFRAKISELTGKLSEIQAAAMQSALQAASRQSQTPPPTQAQVQRRQRQTIAAAEQDFAQQMDMMSQLGITQAEMQKMATMSEKQIEEFMRKRMAEKGIDPAQFATGGDWEAENRRDREAEQRGQQMAAAQQAQEAYMEQMRVTSGKIAEAEQSATERIAALWQSKKPAIDAAHAYLAELGGPEEIMRGTITQEQYNARASRVREAYDDYRAGAYRIWHEYVLAAQGHLKFLLPSAEAVDVNAAASVAEQYLAVTVSEPQINM